MRCSQPACLHYGPSSFAKSALPRQGFAALPDYRWREAAHPRYLKQIYIAIWAKATECCVPLLSTRASPRPSRCSLPSCLHENHVSRPKPSTGIRLRRTSLHRSNRLAYISGVSYVPCPTAAPSLPDIRYHRFHNFRCAQACWSDCLVDRNYDRVI